MSHFTKFPRTLMFMIAVAFLGTNLANAETIELEITGNLSFSGGAPDTAGLDGEAFALTYVFADTNTAGSGGPGVAFFTAQSATLEVLGQSVSDDGAFQALAFVGGDAGLGLGGGGFEFVLADGSAFSVNGNVDTFNNATSPLVGDVISDSILDGASLTTNDLAFFVEAGAPDAFYSVTGGSFTVTAIPEPTSCCILGLAGIAAVSRRRR